MAFNYYYYDYDMVEGMEEEPRPEITLSPSSTEMALKEFLSSVFHDLTHSPPTAKENVNLTAVMARMTSFKLDRPPTFQVGTLAFSAQQPQTPDLIATAVGGVWCWVLVLVLLFKGLCHKRPKVGAPSTLLPAHNIRTVTLGILVLVQITACGEAGLRYWKSPEPPHVLLIPAAAITLFTSLLASVYYHATERWRAHGYVWVCVWMWVFEVGVGLLRVWQVASSGVKMVLVYPCITLGFVVLSSFMLLLDIYTAIIWTYRLRHCEVLVITPGVEEAATAPATSATTTASSGTGAGAAGGGSEGSNVGGITYVHPLCSLLSRATFLWFFQILRLGWKRPLEFTDLGKLPREEESRYQYERFQRCYRDQKMKCRSSSSSESGGVSLWQVFLRVYWGEMVFGGILKFLGDSANYAAPLAISAIVNYVSRVQSGDPEVTEGFLIQRLYYVSWKEVVANGWVVAVAALLASLAQSTFSQASTHLVAMEGIHVKAALQAMIYHKSLRLSSSCPKETNISDDDDDDGDNKSKHESESSSTYSCHRSTGGGGGGGREEGGGVGGGHVGTVINLSSEDADNVMTFFMHCHYIWAIPLKIGVIIVLLWYQLGMAAVVAAIVGLLFLTPLQFWLCKKIAAVNKSFLSVSDERLRQTHELVTGVKLVKLHAWEDVFVKRITRVREKELRLLDRDSILRALMTFLTQFSGALVSLVTFGLYYPLEGEVLEPSRVFSGVALFQQLTVPLFILPIIVSYSIRAKNSVQRLKEFFDSPEIEGPKTPKTPIIPLNIPGNKRHSKVNKTPRTSKEDKMAKGPKFIQLGPLNEESRPSSTYSSASTDGSPAWCSNKGSETSSLSEAAEEEEEEEEEEKEFERRKKRRSGLESEGRGVAVSIQSGSFTWDDRKKLAVLENITTSVPAGGLTIVVGNVGCGKTSLLQALLGEMVTLKGQLRWSGEMSVAYVSQHPWLLNATLKDNVLFGRRLLTKRYQRVLQACALKPDIEILPAGDQTEIGERGINLSGGQRQRVAIARALYSNARTIIMDCPFSALDTGVAGHVWEEGVIQLLLSHRRTVILTTHLTHLTRHADKVIYLENGRIKHQGSPKEIAAIQPNLWKDWAAEGVLGSGDRERRFEGRTTRERWKLLRVVTRISIQRASMSRALRREGREEIKEPQYCNNSPVRHYSIKRHHACHNVLLPGDECEYLPALTPPLPRNNQQTNKKTLFRIKSSAPAFGRKGSRSPQKCLPRHAKSLPPQSRPPPRMRSSPDVVPQGNMLHRLFSNASLRSNKRPRNTSLSDKWHLGRILTSNNLGEDDLQEDLELEEEVPLDEDIEDGKLMSEEERERGRISKWNYVVYMKACGIGWCLSYLFFAVAGQGVSVFLDFWLERWSSKASTWNMTKRETWKDYQAMKPIDLDIPEPYDTFVSQTMQDHYPIYGILSGTSIVLALFTNLLGQAAAGKGRRKIHEDMLQNIVSCSVRFFDMTPAGRIMNRFTTDTAMIDKELARSVTHLLFFVLLVTSAIVVNAIVTPAFLAVAIVICAMYYAIQKFFRCSSRELKRLESLSRSPLYSHMSESVSGAMVIRAYGDQQRFTDVLLHRLDTHVVAFTLLHAGNRWLGISLDYIGSTIVFLATIASLLWSTVIGHDLTPARVGLAISYTLLVPVYLNWVVRFLADTEMCLNALERIHHYSTLPTEEEGGGGSRIHTSHTTRSTTPAGHEDSSCINSISYRSTRSGSSSTSRSSGFPPGWPLEGKVEFQDVTLTYDPSFEPVLRELNFTIKSGEKVGLCGRTGSGKSSLILSLYRLVEASRGRILLDGTDILQVPLALLRGSISVIPQDTHLFSGTVRFNLDPLVQHPDEHLWRALEVAQLKSLVSAMYMGLDSEVGEGGSNFSAGQRQLFCIARAILRRSSLLILDEATSALDASTERALHHALDTAFSHATIIKIAHGVSGLLEYPRILVLENGKLVEDGNPRELAQKENGAFAKLLAAANEAPES